MKTLHKYSTRGCLILLLLLMSSTQTYVHAEPAKSFADLTVYLNEIFMKQRKLDETIVEKLGSVHGESYGPRDRAKVDTILKPLLEDADFGSLLQEYLDSRPPQHAVWLVEKYLLRDRDADLEVESVNLGKYTFDATLPDNTLPAGREWYRFEFYFNDCIYQKHITPNILGHIVVLHTHATSGNTDTFPPSSIVRKAREERKLTVSVRRNLHPGDRLEIVFESGNPRKLMSCDLRRYMADGKYPFTFEVQ